MAWRSRQESRGSAADRDLVGDIRRVHHDSRGPHGPGRKPMPTLKQRETASCMTCDEMRSGSGLENQTSKLTIRLGSMTAGLRCRHAGGERHQETGRGP
jgi:hypothetical protein